MSTNRQTRSNKTSQSGFSRMEKFHPFKTFMFFGLVGSTVLFLTVSFLYFISITGVDNPPQINFPKAFSVSTVFLLLSSYSISGVVAAFRNDSIKKIKVALLSTLLLGGMFCITQLIGWKKLIDSGLFLNSQINVSYLYIITGIHFLHVAGGMIYLLILTAGVFGKSNDMVKSLLYFTDDYQLTRLQLASIYWHFIDALWILLFFMFLFTF